MTTNQDYSNDPQSEYEVEFVGGNYTLPYTRTMKLSSVSPDRHAKEILEDMFKTKITVWGTIATELLK